MILQEIKPIDQGQVRPSVATLKRGRKTDQEIISEYEKAKAKQQPTLILTGKHVEGIAQIPFELLSTATKENAWRLSDDEIPIIANPLADVLNEYLPSIMKNYPKIAVLALSVISLGSKKAFDVQKVKAVRKLEKEHQEITQGNPPPIEPAKPGILSRAEELLQGRTKGAVT